jgi:hypothetical protein
MKQKGVRYKKHTNNTQMEFLQNIKNWTRVKLQKQDFMQHLYSKKIEE